MKPMKSPASQRIDAHIGRRIRMRRWLRGLTQQELGQAIGVVFQQVQKYESGSDRISASRLFEVSQALGIPVSYFFEGLDDVAGDHLAEHQWQEREAMLLIRYFSNMSERSRHQLQELMRSLRE